jgi:D-glycero-D-manno-heptose 1,7-bisphosphate phosphatase
MKSALFLDRDGVINVEKNYVYRIKDFEFTPFIFDICREYEKKGFLIFIITNQSGIARKRYSLADFEKLTRWMENQFEKKGITIAKTYYCPHHPDYTGNCSCRKPEPGMILQAQKEFNVNLKKSVLIGDKKSDIEAGIRAGIEQNYFIEELI